MITNPLKNHILRFANPVKTELQEFLNTIEPENINNKQYILEQGQHCRYTYFIIKGCFRSFFINKKGVDTIINFGIENWWLTDFDSFINKSISQLNIQATEESLVLKISKEKLDTILNRSLEMNKYFRIILEKVRIADQRRIQFMYNLSGEELYNTFCEYNPDSD
ncbi:Crp/Fnr family transcriptional regulator [Aquimarina sp. RZ0]|uniref:Crp/Fnr family transcriptional regulator n=1 Tax=Aquimarina sp. RZ0 TaxID=2607730 RepID=UPI0011F16096|nr:cyclic nucleotide-binding domain-containing protein [Aquimarina sp. RZ0]KAA1241566.1 Crp/Fnr family transcriptional regulator [Aquimarina sp. RZ0]